MEWVAMVNVRAAQGDVMRRAVVMPQQHESLLSDVAKFEFPWWDRAAIASGVATRDVSVSFSFQELKETFVAKGIVKWFNPTKGYGFIKPDVGNQDVFVHISAVEHAGLSTLNENQKIEYELVENRGKASAENLKIS